jgi:hypothetical protein
MELPQCLRALRYELRYTLAPFARPPERAAHSLEDRPEKAA